MDLEVLITQKYFITSQGIDRMLMGLTGAIILKQTHVSNDYVGGVCNFHGSVLPQQKFEPAGQCYSSVTAQFYLTSKGKYILEV